MVWGGIEGRGNSSVLYFSCLGFPTFQHLARDHRCTDKVCGINFQSVRNVKEYIQREVVCRSGRFDDAQKWTTDTLPKMRHTQAATSAFQHFSKFDARVLGEVLRTVQHQRIGDTVLLGVLRYIALEEAEVEDMNFRIVLHGELGKGVAVGVFNKQELAALAAALDNGLCLVGV